MPNSYNYSQFGPCWEPWWKFLQVVLQCSHILPRLNYVESFHEQTGNWSQIFSLVKQGLEILWRATSLSLHNLVGIDALSLTSCNNWYIYITSLVDCVIDLHSDFALDWDTFFFLLFRDIRSPKDHLYLWNSPISFEKHLIISWLLYNIPHPGAPFM